jgi:hypothetical protein
MQQQTATTENIAPESTNEAEPKDESSESSATHESDELSEELEELQESEEPEEPELQEPKELEESEEETTSIGLQSVKPNIFTSKSPSLRYNEYIVYDESQIRLRYLVQVKRK